MKSHVLKPRLFFCFFMIVLGVPVTGWSGSKIATFPTLWNVVGWVILILHELIFLWGLAAMTYWLLFERKARKDSSIS